MARKDDALILGETTGVVSSNSAWLSRDPTDQRISHLSPLASGTANPQ
jgi:hypothetical protein